MVTSRTNSVYYFQGFVLNVSKRKLSDSNGHVVKLGSRALDTLIELVLHQGELVTKDYLMKTIWSDMVVEENNINQAIGIIRKALADSTSESTFIKTIPGRGYCFVADVEKGVENKEAINIQATGSNSEPSPESNTFINALTHQPLKLGTAFLGMLFLFGLFFFFILDTSKEPELLSSTQSQTLNSPIINSSHTTIPGSIAVMPFTNLNQDDANELFVLSLHDELINQLSKISNLKIIARDSVVSLYEEGMSIFEIAEVLNVESLLEGTILVLGDNARINLQMLDASTGVVLWADSLEIDTQDLSKIFSIQNQIALNVVNALKIEIHPLESASIATLPTQSFEAYRYYLAARTAHKHQDNEEKWVLMRKALEIDPNYADAHLFFASINSALAITPLNGFTTEDHLQFMIESTDKFIELEPERPDGYALKAVTLGMQQDWEGVADQVEILDELDASFSEMKYLGILLMGFGDFQNAINIYEDSLLIEPVNLYSRALLMATYEMAGNRERAREEYAIGNDLKSAWWGDNVNILLALGRKEPLTGVDDLSGVSPELSYALHNIDNPDIVVKAVETYLNNEAKNTSEAIHYGALAAYYGDINSANSLLRISMNGASTSIFWAWLPIFDEVRHTEDFGNILVDFGLIRYWQNHGWPDACQPHDDTFNCEWTAY